MEKIHSIIVGHMLGDGHIAKVQKGNSYFTIHRKADHHPYNIWTKNILQKDKLIISRTYPSIRESGGSHNFPSSYLRTGRDKFWTEQRLLWYKNGRKILPMKYIKNNFSNISFLLWFLDDGDSSGRISTDNFPLREIIFLRDLIHDKYGIKFNIQTQYKRPQHHILRCPKGKMSDSLTILQCPNVSIPCVLYKFNFKY
jgi:hypothetical protein